MQNQLKNPTVYITGAGPGDPGLLTVKAKEILSSCEAIVYDTLVSKEILELIANNNSKAKLIFVGKKAYQKDKSVTQEKIHNLLLDLSKEYKSICRLKGGDPSVFGRVGEESEFLVKNGIDFEIVPGVTSVVSASAYAGIPLTHRDCTSSFTVVTAHEDPESKDCPINWNSFDPIKTTLVILMGTKNLPKISEKLISLGRDKDTPVAIVYKGTTSEQETLVTKLSTVVKDIENSPIKPPSLIIVGEVVKYRDVMNWFETKSLFGKRILLTRAKLQSKSFASKLQQYGAKTIVSPVVQYELNEEELFNKKIVNNISNFDYIFFTSQNAVRFFFEVLRRNYYDSRALANTKVAAVGYKTKQELAKYNINADFIPTRFSLSDLVEELSVKDDLSKRKILYPTQSSVEHDVKFKESMTEWGIYKAKFSSGLEEEVVEEIKKGLDVLTLFSSNTAQHFYELLVQQNLLGFIKHTKIAVVGSETANKAKEVFGKVDIIAEPFTEDGLIRSLENYFKDKALVGEV